MEIIFATHNAHKVGEIQSLCPENIQLKSLKEIDFNKEVPETSDTIAGNSFQKAEYIFKQFGKAVFSEDTGLEVAALNNLPGVRTARFAGEHATAEDNIQKLLLELNGKSNRNAQFVTVITFIDEAEETHQFKGVCQGEILMAKTGNDGFGYDPIFKPLGSELSFAEMPLSDKNIFSHRAKAFKLFVEFLNRK